MNIVVPNNFWHAGNLSARYSIDPRHPIRDLELAIDMRECQFVAPAAVLWCAILPLLAVASGLKSQLLVPENMGVCVYLKSTGLFTLLQNAGVDVDDRGIALRSDPQLILPLTLFNSTNEVEKLSNDALENLGRTGHGAANLYPLVTETFAELALNAVQHAESAIGAVGLIQFYEFRQGKRFICVVADGGIGIRRSLEKNPELVARVPYDWVAIELALRERVSGTGSSTRGIGLFGIGEDMRKAGRQLIIHSGLGMLELSETIESRARRTTLFPGTLAYASIPT